MHCKVHLDIPKANRYDQAICTNRKGHCGMFQKYSKYWDSLYLMIFSVKNCLTLKHIRFSFALFV